MPFIDFNGLAIACYFVGFASSQGVWESFRAEGFDDGSRAHINEVWVSLQLYLNPKPFEVAGCDPLNMEHEALSTKP